MVLAEVSRLSHPRRAHPPAQQPLFSRPELILDVALERKLPASGRSSHAGRDWRFPSPRAWCSASWSMQLSPPADFNQQGLDSMNELQEPQIVPSPSRSFSNPRLISFPTIEILGCYETPRIPRPYRKLFWTPWRRKSRATPREAIRKNETYSEEQAG
jgi:hypothetical protein